MHFCLSSHAESALFDMLLRVEKCPFFSNLTMPFFGTGGNTKSMATTDQLVLVIYEPRGMNAQNIKMTISHCHIPNMKPVGFVVAEK